MRGNHISVSKFRFIKILILLLIVCFASVVYGKTGKNKPEVPSQNQAPKVIFTEDVDEQNQNEPGIFGLSLAELMNLEIRLVSKKKNLHLRHLYLQPYLQGKR